MPVQAYLVLFLTLFAFVGALFWMFWKAHKAKPKIFYSGIGVKFMNGADETQKGIPEACEVLALLIRERYQDDADYLLKHLWIEIHGKDATITSSSIPTGQTFRDDGTPAVLMGTCDAFRLMMFSPLTYVAKVRQNYYRDGSLKPAGLTALFHEVAEHIVPFIFHGDWNAEHDPKWMLFTRQMDAAYRLEMGGHV